MMVNSITEAKAHLSALVERAAHGEEIIIGKAGKPVAVLAPYEQAKHARKPGRLRKKITIADDFDELPDEIAKAFGVESE